MTQWRMTRFVRWEATTYHSSPTSAQAQAARSIGDVLNLEPGQATALSKQLTTEQPLTAGPYTFTLEEEPW